MNNNVHLYLKLKFIIDFEMYDTGLHERIPLTYMHELNKKKIMKKLN